MAHIPPHGAHGQLRGRCRACCISTLLLCTMGGVGCSGGGSTKPTTYRVGCHQTRCVTVNGVSPGTPGPAGVPINIGATTTSGQGVVVGIRTTVWVDIDGDGVIDVDEDTNGNGVLDPGEDKDGDGKLDVKEDAAQGVTGTMSQPPITDSSGIPPAKPLPGTIDAPPLPPGGTAPIKVKVQIELEPPGGGPIDPGEVEGDIRIVVP